jgi:uncharacterized protein (TIGR03067 family)
MRAAFIILLALGTVSGAEPEKKDPAKQELANLTGKWQCVAGEEGGAKATDDLAKQLRLVFDGEKFKAYIGDMVLMAGTIKVDPTAKPKTIDLQGAEGRLKGQTGEGIYELDGDALKLCLVEPGEKRPTEFKTAKQGQHLLVYKRVKE